MATKKADSAKKDTATKTGTANPKLRIKLRSYDLKMLENSVTKIVGLLVKS